MKNSKLEINIHSLAEGSNEIEFQVQPKEVDIENCIAGNNIECSIVLNKNKSEVSFEGKISFTLEIECSRCFKPFTLDKNNILSAYFVKKESKKKAETEHLSTKDVLTEYYDNDLINIAPILHDAIALSIPMKPLCSSNCKGLCPLCGVNLNIEKCSCKNEKTDPRWDPLKKLLENS